METTKNRWGRVLAVCVSGTLFALAIAKAQLGCATQDTPVTAEDAVPTVTPAAQAATGAEPAVSAAAPSPNEAQTQPTASAAPEPSVAASALPDPAWFPASKAGGFMHPPKKAPAEQQQNANPAPQRP